MWMPCTPLRLPPPLCVPFMCSRCVVVQDTAARKEGIRILSGLVGEATGHRDRVTEFVKCVTRAFLCLHAFCMCFSTIARSLCAVVCVSLFSHMYVLYGSRLHNLPVNSYFVNGLLVDSIDLQTTLMQSIYQVRVSPTDTEYGILPPTALPHVCAPFLPLTRCLLVTP